MAVDGVAAEFEIFGDEEANGVRDRWRKRDSFVFGGAFFGDWGRGK